MYTLFAIDTTLRITAALLVLFVVVPALAWRRPESFSRMEWFWWNLGVGITLLTIAGQLFTLLNIASTPTYLVLFAAIIVFGRARAAGMPPLRWLAESYRDAVLFTLRVLDGRGDLRTRVPARLRDALQRTKAAFHEHRGVVAAFAAVGLAAAVTRFYRPFATANLGFSDTYAHLYLMRLLDEGKQVDPAWGPYPRGMHFLMLAIERLTNVDTILMMNFFGAFAGVLIVLAVADTARRVTRNNIAALIAGLIFATMIGGARQYFALGGSVSSRSEAEAREILARPYSDLLANAGEFDVLLTAFQRQTSTLPQELAIVLLLPGTLFLLDWLRTRDRWRLTGFIGCTAAIAAVHSGVVVPLVVLCVAVTIASLGVLRRHVSASPEHTKAVAAATALQDNLAAIARGAVAGACGIALGSTWLLGFIGYSSVAGSPTEAESHVGGATAYYFPFLRAAGEATSYMMLTPFLIAIAITAIILAIAAIRMREPHTLTIALGTLFFICTHSASVLGIPELIEVRRNAVWLAMMVAVLLGIVITVIAARLPRRFTVAVPALALVLWCVTIPNLAGSSMRSRILDYSGYGITTYAVLRISQSLEPFTWTLVSYGQEYPMVLGRGFHLNGSDFVEQFDPAEASLRIPTPHVFIAVEKTPHRFQINNWSKRFDRAAVEERLQTWCTVYGLTHRNIRIWLDDENVRIYEIVREEGRS
jgi:hypothetical protein